MQQIQYYKSAWGDIKNSPGWFGKLCILALVNFIPVFGQIVTFGYLYGWAREIAWGTHEPMPARIFANDDGKLYRRGWFILVLTFVATLVPAIVMGIGSGMQGAGLWGVSAGSRSAANSIVSGLGLLVYLVGVVGLFFCMVLAWIGSMRISIYDRLSAGFQIGKIWKMFRHDTGGIMRVFGMYLLVWLIIGFVLSIICFIFAFFVVFAGLAGLAASGYNVSAIQHMTDAQTTVFALRVIASSGAVGFLGLIAVVFLSLAAQTFVMLLVARALGYWTMQFDVPHWRGQDDPMPFETAPPASSAMPVGPTPPTAQQSYQNSNQQPYGAYGQQGVQPSAAGAPIPAVPFNRDEPEAAAEPEAVVEPEAVAEPTAGLQGDSAADDVEAALEPEAEPAASHPAQEPNLASGQLSGFTYTGTSGVQTPVSPSGADPSAETVPDLLVIVPETPQDASEPADEQ